MSALTESSLFAISEEEIKFNLVSKNINELTDTISDSLNNLKHLFSLEELIVNNKSDINSINAKYINLAIENICNNLGASSEKYIVSAESDHYASLSLESTRSFIEKIWDKVKLAISNLWDMISTFWDDNFSSLRRVKNNLLAILVEVNKNYTNSSNILYHYNNSNILIGFNNGKDVDEKNIESFINTHSNNFNKLKELVKHTKYFNSHIKNISEEEFEKEEYISDILSSLVKGLTHNKFKFGDERYPLISGECVTIEYMESLEGIVFSSDKTTLEIDSNKINIFYISSHKLKYLIKMTVGIIDETIKIKDIQENLRKEYDILVERYDRLIQNQSEEFVKNHRKVIKYIYKVNSVIPGMFNLVVTSNIKLARNIIMYSKFCLKSS